MVQAHSDPRDPLWLRKRVRSAEALRDLHGNCSEGQPLGAGIGAEPRGWKAWMRTPVVVCPHRGVFLFSLRVKDGSADTRLNVEEPPKPRAGWKKPDTKGNVWCDSPDMECPGSANL